MVYEFPKDLLGLPPDQELEFGIELLSGSTFVSIAPYRITPVELKELNIQLQDLVDESFIRSSVSFWGVSVLFVK